MVFLDFNLPKATTLFYLSLIPACALLFTFIRFFSLRNWDVITLYLLVPGFLFLDPEGRDPTGWGYIWLMAGSACFFLRCLLDMTLVSRPNLQPNLNLTGLSWLGGAIF